MNSRKTVVGAVIGGILDPGGAFVSLSRPTRKMHKH